MRCRICGGSHPSRRCAHFEDTIRVVAEMDARVREKAERTSPTSPLCRVCAETHETSTDHEPWFQGPCEECGQDHATDVRVPGSSRALDPDVVSQLDQAARDRPESPLAYTLRIAKAADALKAGTGSLESLKTALEALDTKLAEVRAKREPQREHCSELPELETRWEQANSIHELRATTRVLERDGWYPVSIQSGWILYTVLFHRKRR